MGTGCAFPQERSRDKRAEEKRAGPRWNGMLTSKYNLGSLVGGVQAQTTFVPAASAGGGEEFPPSSIASCWDGFPAPLL